MTDNINSTTVTANADGTFNSELRYSAFGEIRYSSGVTPTNYQYTGQLSQQSIGLDYYVARWYDPYLAHFVQADTEISDPSKAQTFDRYMYANQNPIRFNDPTGHDAGCMGMDCGDLPSTYKPPVYIPPTPTTSSSTPQYSWFDYIGGAAYQYSNNMSLGLVDKFAATYNTCFFCNRSEAFKQGQQGGQAASIVVGSTEQVLGIATTAAALFGITGTIAGGAVCSAGTVGVCALPAGGLLVLEGAAAIEGGLEYTYGSTVVAFANNNPVGGGGGNSAQWRPLSKGEIKILQENGYNIEQEKGNSRQGQWDLYKDEDGNIYIKPKGGIGPGEETGLNINDYKK